MILYNLLRNLLYFVIMILAIFNGKLLKFFKSRLFQKIENDDFLNSGEEAIFIHFSTYFRNIRGEKDWKKREGYSFCYDKYWI